MYGQEIELFPTDNKWLCIHKISILCFKIKTRKLKKKYLQCHLQAIDHKLWAFLVFKEIYANRSSFRGSAKDVRGDRAFALILLKRIY